jgi:ShK domain-like
MVLVRFITRRVVWTGLDVPLLLLLLLCLLAVSAAATGAAVAATSNKVGGECIPLATDPSRFHCYDISASLSSSTSSSSGLDYDDIVEDTTCMDTEKECREWMEKGECSRNPNYMLIFCPHSCETCITGHAGVVQVSLDHEEGGNPRRVVERLAQTHSYVQNKVASNVRFLHSCKNKHELCTHWATLGECETNPNYMLRECAAACRKCH